MDLIIGDELVSLFLFGWCMIFGMVVFSNNRLKRIEVDTLPEIIDKLEKLEKEIHELSRKTNIKHESP
jgi:hypothetical protein